MPNKNIRSLSARKGLKDNLFENISRLAENQSAPESFQKLSRRYHIDDSVVSGTASFYDFTREEERVKKIRVCNGTACMVAGTQDRVSQWVSKEFPAEEIGHVACVGHCHTNSAILFRGNTYSLTSEDHLNQLKEAPESEESLPLPYEVDTNTTPVLTAPVDNPLAFFDQALKVQKNTDDVLGELKSSGLRGRGGAGFPFWFKLDAVKSEEGEEKYVVCNADEGDPGAFSDMYLLEHQPLKVLYGMYASGIVAGANKGVLYIRGEYPNSIRRIEKEIKWLEEKGLLGDFEFKVIRGQGSYVCGEETALLSSIEGLRPEVRVRPPYPAQYGLFGKPTLLSNVETFANIHWIIEHGGKKYASLGTSRSAGTKLVSFDGYFNRPGVFELEMGTPLREAVYQMGRGLNDKIKAVQIGGPLGGIVPVEKIDGLTLDFESFDEAGFLLGHASFVSIPESFPIIRFLEHLLKFTADESCGKCYPCRIGSHRGYELLKKAQHENFRIDRELFNDLIETLELGSLCALGGGVPLPLKNALTHFETELKEYFKD
jgi:NADH-quinone oxidoreductase subunit F